MRFGKAAGILLSGSAAVRQTTAELGCFSALGFEFLDKSGQPVRNGAAGLADLAEIRSGHVLPVLKECTFRVACDVENSLCGELGCSSVFGPQKGAEKRACRQMDNGSFPMHS